MKRLPYQKQGSSSKHVWVCGITGLLAGFLAFFICTHSFTFHWPFNWPVTWESVNEPIQGQPDSQQPTTITVTQPCVEEDYPDEYDLPVGTKVLVWHQKLGHSAIKRVYGHIKFIDSCPDRYRVELNDGEEVDYSLHEFIEIYPKDPENWYKEHSIEHGITAPIDEKE